MKIKRDNDLISFAIPKGKTLRKIERFDNDILFWLSNDKKKSRGKR